MRNETLFQRYKELCIASLQVAQHVRGDKGLVAWQDRGADAEMHRLLRAHSGVDEDSGFTDFSPHELAPYFSAFLEEALKDPILSQLYSDKDLGPILVYQLTQNIRLLLFQIVFANADENRLEEKLAHCYAEFEDLLYEEDWITATIYPLVNFYSKERWEKHQKLKSSGVADQGTIVLDDHIFRIGDDFEIKQLNFITLPLLDKSAETSSFRAHSPYRDFTGAYYALEVRKSRRKSADSQYNLTSYLIGRPMGLPRDDVNLEHRAVVNLPEWLLLALRLFKPGDIGIAPYRYISDYPRPLYVPDLYPERYVELAQVEVYEEAPYILDSTEVDALSKMYRAVSDLLSDKPNGLEHIDIAQRYFQYSYSHKLTDDSRLPDRVVSLVFALEALLLLGKDDNRSADNRGRLTKLGKGLIGDLQIRSGSLIENAYEKVRNCIAHGRKPTIQVRRDFVTRLENCVRHAMRRAIGLAISRGIRSKEALQAEIDKAYKLNKGTKSETGTKQLRKDADAPFS